MNHESISQICFAEIYVVPSHQTARSLFTRLPHGMAYADTLIECLATGYLIAVVESICIKEMQQQIDPDIEVVVGRSIRIEHRAPILRGQPSACRAGSSKWEDAARPSASERSMTTNLSAKDR